MEASEVLFTIPGIGLHVTAEVTTMWGIILVLVVLALIVRKNLRQEDPGKLQNAAEMAVEKLRSFFGNILGPERTDRFFGLFATLFIFIICCNYSGLLPGAGTVWGFKAPTSSLSVTVGLALVVFGATHVLGVRTHGLGGYGKHFLKPVAIMLPFLLLDEIVRPVSLSLRLFGNIYGEETVTEQLYELLPIGAPIIMMVLSLLFCAIQAVVFTMLAAIYIEGATGSGH